MVSPVRPATNDPNIHYYNMMIQTEEEVFRSVSYREDLRDQLLQVEKNKSPVKLLNIKRKINFHDSTKTDIEINDTTELEEQDELPFKCKKVSEDICPVETVATIIKNKKNNDFVSLHCYVDIEDRPITPMKLKYQKNTSAVNKMEVACNDDSGTIKLTLWGSCIYCINKNGVYLLEKVKVKEWPKGILSLTTTPGTCIKESGKIIEKSKSSLKELVSYCVNFPPTLIQALSSQKVCPQCYKAVPVESSSKLFTCAYCQAMALEESLSMRYILKLEFEKENKKYVTMYNSQVEQYFACKNKSVPNKLQELVLEMLSDRSTVLVMDSRNTCIGFKEM